MHDIIAYEKNIDYVLNEDGSFLMFFINKMRRIFPTKQVNVQELERQSLTTNKKNINNTVYKNLGETEPRKESEDGEPDGIDGEYEIIEREILPEQIVCPDCGGFTLEGLEYCDKCGGDLMSL